MLLAVNNDGQSDGPQDVGLTTVWKELGADNAYWIAAHHYIFTLVLIACFAALWWDYRRKCATLERYRGKGE